MSGGGWWREGLLERQTDTTTEQRADRGLGRRFGSRSPEPGWVCTHRRGPGRGGQQELEEGGSEDWSEAPFERPGEPGEMG